MASHRVLLVDDDQLFTRSIGDLLRLDGLDVLEAGSVAEARRLVPGVDVMVLDNRLPDGQGLDLVRELHEKGWVPKILLVTANPGLENAIDALRHGIEDYLSKPIDIDQLQLAIQRCFRTLGLERIEDLERRRRASERDRVQLVGGVEFASVRHLLERACRSTSSVLLTGETGTGKTAVARAIHYGGRPEAPFVAINCAALPATLIEAELFGAARGAYTGAESDRRGLFELADQGTLFLDEIGEMPVEIQAKLLGVLDDKRIRQIGGVKETVVDARVIAATNVDPERAVAEGTLRRDLYYRLNVLRIEVPPLRQRRGDLAALVESLLEGLGVPRGRRLGDGELAALAAYPWPGNIRELRNVLERSLILSESGPLFPSRLLVDAEPSVPHPRNESEIWPLAEVEKEHLLRAVAACKTQIEAAARLGIGVATLRRKLERYRAEESAHSERSAQDERSD